MTHSKSCAIAVILRIIVSYKKPFKSNLMIFYPFEIITIKLNLLNWGCFMNRRVGGREIRPPQRSTIKIFYRGIKLFYRENNPFQEPKRQLPGWVRPTVYNQ